MSGAIQAGRPLVARLLELQRPDGQWAVGVYDGDDWDSTTDALWLLLELGAAYGHPSRSLAERLPGEQLADGGWNCEAPPSIRSSFHSTLCVLEGLLGLERTTGPDAVLADARRRARSTSSSVGCCAAGRTVR